MKTDSRIELEVKRTYYKECFATANFRPCGGNCDVDGIVLNEDICEANKDASK